MDNGIMDFKTNEEIRRLLDEREDFRQKIHDQNRLISDQKFMITNLSQDFALLQIDFESVKQENLLKAKNILDLGKKIQYLEADPKHEDINCNEVDEVAFLQTTKANEDLNSLRSDNETLRSEITTLNKERAEFKEHEKKLLCNIETLEDVNSQRLGEVGALRSTLQIAEQRSSALEEYLDTCRNNLRTTKEELQEAKEDRIQLESELYAARAPSMVSQGNSIFSELEDNRQKTNTKYVNLKAKYSDLHKKSLRMSQEISKLISDKVSSVRMLEDLTRDEVQSSKAMISALEQRIAHLEGYCKQLEGEVHLPVKVVSDLNSENLNFVQTLVSDAKKAELDMAKELNEKSMSLLMNQQVMNVYLADIRKLKVENAKLKGIQTEGWLAAVEKSTIEVNCMKSSSKKRGIRVDGITNTVDGDEQPAFKIVSVSREGLAKVTKKLTFVDDSENMDSDDDVVPLEAPTVEAGQVVAMATATTSQAQDKEEESKTTKMAYPKLEMRFKK